MTKKVAVFDLDGTLGDFTVIDFFSHVFDIESLQGRDKKLEEHYALYDKETKSFLNELKENFEQKMIEEGYTEKILRPNIVDIFNSIKNKVKGCLIYSNNGHLYNLTFAGRAIESIVKKHKLFKGYIDRYDSIRGEFDGSSTGARNKTVKTIQKATKEYMYINVEPSEIIFFDDLVHPDLMYDDYINYVLVNRYDLHSSDDFLRKIFNLFEGELYEMFKKYKTMSSIFFNLYHIKQRLGIVNIENMEEIYISHSKYNRHVMYFHNDYNIIKKRIDDFIEIKEGGKRKSKTKKNRKHKTMKNKHRKLF
jgi:hypothetical protein